MAREGPLIASRRPALLALTLVSALSIPSLPQALAAERPEPRQEVPATANDYRTGLAHNSPALAADPTEPRFVALASRLDAPGPGCALQVSGDGGRGWIPVNPVPRLPAGAKACYAPEVAFDRDGTLYYLFVGLRGQGNSPIGVFLTKSEDRGRSFDKPRRLLGAGNYQVRMALDQTLGDAGRLHLVWLQTSEDAPVGGLPPPPNPIVAAHSDDGGDSFSKPVAVSNHPGRRHVAPAIAVGREHALHVLYYDLEADRLDYQGLAGPRWSGHWSLIAASSFDGGEHFEPEAFVNDRVVPPELVMLIFTMPPPTLAAGKSGLFAAWHDRRNGDWDVFLSAAGERARSWGKPKRLNDDRLRNRRHQYLPRLSLAPEGRLDAVFYDRRDDPKNIDNHVYYTSSSDAGRSFSPNLRLTSTGSDSRYGPRYQVPSAAGKVEFGSRLALLARDASALAAWTDTRNSLAPLPQDIFATEVRFAGQGASAGAGEPSGPEWALLAALGLGALFSLWAIRALGDRRSRRPGAEAA